MFFWAYCFVNVLTLSRLGSLWFLVWYSPILLIKSICAFILSVVSFYSERPLLSKNILFYVWSISIAKDHRFAEKCSPRLFLCSSLFFLFFGKTLGSNIMVYHKKVSDYTTFTLMITWSFRYFNFTLPFLKLFVT